MLAEGMGETLSDSGCPREGGRWQNAGVWGGGQRGGGGGHPFPRRQWSLSAGSEARLHGFTSWSHPAELCGWVLCASASSSVKWENANTCLINCCKD